MCCIPTLRSTEHFVPNCIAGIRGTGRGGEDSAAELGAGDPGERRLVLVFAADLEEVEEVGCGGVDRDEILGW